MPSLIYIYLSEAPLLKHMSYAGYQFVSIPYKLQLENKPLVPAPQQI